MLSFRSFIVLLLSLLAMYLSASVNVDWYATYGSAGNESATASCYDSQGNYYLAGDFKGSLQFGSTMLESGTHTAIYIAKYASTGQLLWVKHSTSSGATVRSAFVTGIVADASQNLYLCGSFDGLFKLSGVSVTSPTSVDSYLSKLDSSGTCQWIVTGSASFTNKAFGITITNDNYPVICGSYGATQTLFGATVINAGLDDAYVAKFHPNGSLVTLNRWGSIANDVCQSIQILSNGDYVISGYNTNAISFGSTTLPNLGMEIFVCKLNSSLNPLWAKGSICNGTTQNEAIVTADASGIYVFGRYSAGISWDTFSLPNTSYALFALKLDHSGNAVWLRNVLSSGSNRSVKGACIMPNGDIALAGFYNATCTNSLGSYTSAGSNDAYFMVLNPDGNPQMFHSLGGGGIDVGFTLSKNADNELLIAGYFGAANSNFFGTIPVHTGQNDVYAIRLSIQNASIPAAPQNLVLHTAESNLILSWSPVLTSQTGSPLSVSTYQIFGSSIADDGESFELIGQCSGTSYVLPANELSHPHRFYLVKALP